MNIFDDTTYQILVKFLDKRIEDAEKEISTTGTLSEAHAIPLILKSQFNHIVHLETEITELRSLFDKQFITLGERFEKLEARFGHMGIGLTLGFTVLGFLIILFGFLK